MKSILLVTVFACLSAAFAGNDAQGNRVLEVKGTTVRAEKLAIVVEKQTPVMEFASNELQVFLTKATGVKPEIVKVPPADAVSLILGDNSFSRAAGLDVDKLPPEGYYIKRVGNKVFLVGRDSETADPSSPKWVELYPRGTLNAVYDFLERFADARFFFPGDNGTVIPAKGGLFLPERIDIVERPDFPDRSFLHYDGKWYENETYGKIGGKALNQLRLRMSEIRIPNCHGLVYLEYIRRFGKTNPEYFALMPGGKRNNDPEVPHSGHLCFNSGITEVIYQDAKAYLTGKPAETRGLKSWSVNTAQGDYFCIMTQDWMYWCGCPVCSKIAEDGRGNAYKENSQAVSNFMWKLTADFANRLKKEGVKGKLVQAVYPPYDKVPECDIPDNVIVETAIGNPGSSDQTMTDAKVKSWFDKTGRKMTTWSYPGKFGEKAIPGVPALIHNHIGKYYQDRAKWFLGGFVESETDYYLFNYLNYYVFAKVAWNNSIDLNALLDDHFKVMFGKGAPFVKKFFDGQEEIWSGKILGNTVETGLGPVTQVPTAFEIWTNIYTPEKLNSFKALFDSAEKAEKGEPLKRIRFMRRNLLDPILAEAENFKRRQSAFEHWEFHVPGKVWLRSCTSDANEVATSVDVTQDADHFIFSFDCEEPRMDEVVAKRNKPDSDVWADSCVELFLNPSGDRKNYCHFVVNPNGTLTDYRCVLNETPDVKWNSGATVAVSKDSGSWKAAISVPKQCLGDYRKDGFPVNFARNRVLSGKQPLVCAYQWSIMPFDAKRGFHAIESFGRMIPAPAERDSNLVKDGMFTVEKQTPYKAGSWMIWQGAGQNSGQKTELDTNCFIIGGKSLHLVNIPGKRLATSQYLPDLKPGKKYTFSYFIKTKLAPTDGSWAFGAYAMITYADGSSRNFPHPPVSGIVPWHRLSFDFTTPDKEKAGVKALLSLSVNNAAGEAWFDDVRIEEVAP